MQAINPTTEEPLAEWEEDGTKEVERKLAAAWSAFEEWRETDLARRAELLAATAGVLRSRRDPLARLMASEMGKPVTEGVAEVDKCAWVCEHYAEHAAAYLRPEEIPTDASQSFVRYEPLGPVLAIMPWNFPLWQVFRCAAPAVAAGNVVLLKHAANVPGCADQIEQIFLEAGLPEGVLGALRVGHDALGPIIEHPNVRAVTLTGSESAGRSVGAQAGKALKKSVLELGGSDAFIVLSDADVRSVARQAALARCINSGQSCIAAKRFIVVEGVAEEFEERLCRELDALQVGDPLDPATQVGPLARLDLLEALHAQVEQTVSSGARLVTGGRRLQRKGWFYAPTLLSGVLPGMAAFDEETFGPVAAVTPVFDWGEAVELANRSSYGLGASIWTSDPERAAPLANLLETGHVSINGIVKSDPRLPFGGVKRSGYGRELGRHGILEFTNAKSVWIA
jgi:acyl-CoA reductase-like NAD-dependent aldehyde dehydrogenase